MAGERSPRTAIAAALLLALGCTGPLSSLRHRASLSTEAGAFELEYASRDRAAQERVQRSIQRAIEQLSRWGTLHEPVRVRILPSHQELEEAVDRPGYGWLRAWARYDEVFLQSPRTWGLFGATQRELDELMLHELTHCLMYQLSATRTGWTRKEIPLWFREGLASYVATQGHRWPSLEELARFLERNPDLDPVASPEGLYQGQSDVVYAAAHHAFTFLVRRYGEEAPRSVMAAMQAGRTFPDAFAEAIGVSVETYTSEFNRYVRLRGFRGGRVRLRQHRAAPVAAPPAPAPEPVAEPEPPPARSSGCRLP